MFVGHHTITAGNEKEFAKHQVITKELQISFYICKPFHSCEGGISEKYNSVLTN